MGTVFAAHDERRDRPVALKVIRRGSDTSAAWQRFWMIDHLSRTSRVLNRHELSLPEHYLMCSAGYRVTLAPRAFIAHAFAASAGDRRGAAAPAVLASALRRLRGRGLMTCLTAAGLRAERRRQAASTVPEIFDDGYRAGHVDFTPKGYDLHRKVIRAIHGSEFLDRSDAGFNVDLKACRFDVFAVRAEDCSGLMDELRADITAYAGDEHARVTDSSRLEKIATWRPNRFFARKGGYHGIVRFARAI